MFYYIQPEVSGGLGESTIIDTTIHPPKVSQLEYKFEGWLGDDLLESFPCFIVTKKLADTLTTENLSGFKIMPVATSISENFIELHPNTYPPKFLWLQIKGSAKIDDFGLSEDHILVISEKALKTLRKNKINHAEIRPL
ncbi:hypothetical protein [Pseudomonas viridiflava]|uniref:hypothetical protein n=1 Tax=Pseudomonas viridiflava TaxID=33069 RepID=UPI002A69BD36|nr:hypothetical protein [Pseudomonas viridiflava]MDY0918844.1 hypothetical protein [Pseudomonas viridiflava]